MDKTGTAAHEKPARVLLVDDQVLYREGLCELMHRWPEFDVVGEASNGKEAVEFCRRIAPDLVLMDVQMPIMDGVEATGIICGAHPGIAIVMLTVTDDDEHLFRALYNGARGYILKDMPSRQLRNRLQGVIRGGGVLSDAVTARVLREFGLSRAQRYSATQDGEQGTFAQLSDREVQILRLVAKGLSNEEIGAQLYLSAGTVKKQLSALMQKLYLSNRVQVAVYAIRAGLVD
ncbi:DNA-binding response regulator [Gordonibacter sp. 28C]|uniref:response regulator n=1 Tax=Gordonibacter sp. 28C TaxID=2078569 RepID=UPI000DF780CA|nr:response regulator transcription factor [Gordonibacter sp. 28C]RDB62338.1 DNA-binding response regulator [Gordonibacter sp. 28C]